jgi:hypothetical protein
MRRQAKATTILMILLTNEKCTSWVNREMGVVTRKLQNPYLPEKERRKRVKNSIPRKTS